MSGIEQFNVTKPGVTNLLDLIREDREVIAVFLKPNSRSWSKSHGDQDAPLTWLLQSDEFRLLCPEIGRVKKPSGRYSTLNRLELEGSLASILLEGGCHGRGRSMDLGTARQHVTAAVDAVFPEPFNHISACRLDDWDWCEFTDGAAIWSSHFAWEGSRTLLWVLCTRDID